MTIKEPNLNDYNNAMAAHHRAETPVTERDTILAALDTFMRQRSGIEFGNYGDVASFRAEQRSITKDLHEARILLKAVTWRTSIDAEALKYALKHSFSGRLSWVPKSVWECAKCNCVCGVAADCCDEPMRQGGKLDYTTGQYFPTEYRKAVCAVLAGALWNYARDNMPEPEVIQHGDANNLPMRTELRYRGKSAGDFLRDNFRKEFGRAIASRWFN